MLIFADSHRKYLSKTEMSNLENNDQGNVDVLDYSMFGMLGNQIDTKDLMWSELAPEYQVPGPVVCRLMANISWRQARVVSPSSIRQVAM
jgi:hypothetical protein